MELIGLSILFGLAILIYKVSGIKDLLEDNFKNKI